MHARVNVRAITPVQLKCDGLVRIRWWATLDVKQGEQTTSYNIGKGCLRCLHDCLRCLHDCLRCLHDCLRCLVEPLPAGVQFFVSNAWSAPALSITPQLPVPTIAYAACVHSARVSYPALA